MNSRNTTAASGILGAIGVVAIMLKLGGVITFSWWIVLLPFYLGALLVVAVFAVAAVIYWVIFVATWVSAKVVDRRKAREAARFDALRAELSAAVCDTRLARARSAAGSGARVGPSLTGEFS